jgi:hypothetical protein
MIFIDKMKNFKIYKTKTFLPTTPTSKKKGAAILLLTPNYESSKKLMNNSLFVNSGRYASYYIEKDISYYINSKVAEEIDESAIIKEHDEYLYYLEEKDSVKRSELPDDAFGIPDKRKYPLYDEAHVRSAIKFFNYVDSEDEELLARNIIKAMKKFGIYGEVEVSEKNRFSKYYHPANKKKDDKKSTKESSYDIISSRYLVENAPTNSINTGDKLILFNEATVHDKRLKQLLYTSRIRKRKEVLNLLDSVRKDNPWISYTFPELNRYLNRNIFVDLYYYSSIFFDNNTWIMKKGLDLYINFLGKLVNHPNLKNNGYNKKTIFIPIADWSIGHKSDMWNFRRTINPISVIYQLLFENRLRELKSIFGDTDVLFIASNKYFKVNFSQIDAKDTRMYMTKFKKFCIKIVNNEEFDLSDIDTSADNKETPEVIATKIADKVEKSKGIDLTKHLVKSKEKINKNTKIVKGVTTFDPNKITIQNANGKKTVIANIKDLDDEADYDETDTEDSERTKAIDKLSDAIIAASNDSDSEEDALDKLDDEEIAKIILSLGDEDEVNISAARSTRMSKLNNEILDKEINGRTVKDILEEEKPPKKVVSVDVSSPNKEEWSQLSYINMDKSYDIDKDIVSMFRMFSECTRPMVIKDITATDNSTSEDHVMLYDVKMEDYKGRRFRVKLDIPIMEDNRFYLRGDYKSINTQLFVIPIVKVDTDRCQITSNYRKIFIDRFGDNRGRSLPAVSKLLKALNKCTDNKLKISTGNNEKVCSKYHLPMDYIDIATSISKIESSNWIIMFNQDEIRNKYTVDETKGIPFLYNKKLKAIEYFTYDNYNTTFISKLCDILFEQSTELSELYSNVTRSSGSAYSRAYIMSTDIPLVLVCAYHVGLSTVMDRAGIKYDKVEKLTREIRKDTNKDWIEFDDGYVVYDVNYESSLLLNGLKIASCPTEAYSIDDMDSRNMYLEFLDNFGGRIKADGLDNFYDLFLDPMTKDSLKYYNLPTDYIGVLLYGNTMLVDNKFTKHIDASSKRFRRYQLVSAYTYRVLANAYGTYMNEDRHSATATFSVKQDDVIKTFLTDSITSDDSIINALRDVETTNAVTTKGPSGMNSERAYTLDKRGYDDTMLNVLGMSTGFAGNAGITRQATINSNITKDGYVIASKDREMNDSNTLTATEALIPFGSTRDDPMRTAMSFIQTAKHMVRTESSDPLLVTSGADEAMPYITTDRFAFKAKHNGTVLNATEDFILIEYTDGTKDYINLKEEICKNSDGGYYVPLKLDAIDKIKPGYKFKENQVLAYDRHSFSDSSGESNNLTYNVGTLAKVAILNTDEGFEDAGIISQSMAEKLATRVNIKYTAVINADSTLFKIVKINDHVEASDPLIIWENAFDDEDAAEVMDALTQAVGDEFSDIGKSKLFSEVTGKVTDIKIYRTVELDELSPSLKKLVNAYEKPIREKEKILKENNLPTSSLPAHYKLNPTGKLKRAQEAILVEIFVEYLDTVGVGDKIVYNSANKAVEKGIFPVGLEPYTEFRPNEKIDAFVNDSSISKRIVFSSIIYGSLQKLMIELDRSVKDIMGIEYDDSTV